MRIPRELTVLVALACGVALTWAQEPADTASQGAAQKTVDLTKIERKILAEPEEYVAKKQQYCLLVFGPEAKYRVWLVHDADILYVDRNGDGKLNQIGERLVGNHSGHFKVGNLLEPPGKKHTSLIVSFNPSGGGQGSLSILIGGKFAQTAVFGSSDKPSDAPIVHLNGPVTLKLKPPREVFPRKGGGIGVGEINILRRSREVSLSGCYLGTPGLGSFAIYQPGEVLPQARLTFEVEFSKKAADGRGVRARGTMTPCFDGDDEMRGYVRVPDNAPLGDVELTVTFPDHKEVRALPPVMRKIRIYDK